VRGKGESGGWGRARGWGEGHCDGGADKGCAGCSVGSRHGSGGVGGGGCEVVYLGNGGKRSCCI
jgi:hypothetical protein